MAGRWEWLPEIGTEFPDEVSLIGEEGQEFGRLAEREVGEAEAGDDDAAGKSVAVDRLPVVEIWLFNPMLFGERRGKPAPGRHNTLRFGPLTATDANPSVGTGLRIEEVQIDIGSGMVAPDLLLTKTVQERRTLPRQEEVDRRRHRASHLERRKRPFTLRPINLPIIAPLRMRSEPKPFDPVVCVPHPTLLSIGRRPLDDATIFVATIKPRHNHDGNFPVRLAVPGEMKNTRMKSDAGNSPGGETIDRRIEEAWRIVATESQRAAELGRILADEANTIGHDRGEVHARLVEAGAAYYLTEYDRSRRIATNARQQAAELDDRLLEARGAYLLGLVARADRTPQEAIVLYNEGLALVLQGKTMEGPSTRLRQSEANLQASLGFALRAAGRADAAFACFERVGALGREIEAPALLAQSAYGRAVLHVDRTEFEEASAMIERVRELIPSDAPSILLTSALQLKGRILSDSGRITEALANEIEIGESWEERGYFSGAGLSLCNAGYLALTLGEYQPALDLLSRALNMAVTYRLREIEATALQQIAQVYEAVEENALVVEHYVRSMTIAAEINAYFTESVALYYLSLYYERNGLTGRALSGYLRSLALTRKIGRRTAEYTILNAIAALYLSIGEDMQAERYLVEGFALAGEEGPHAERIDLLITRSVLCRRRRAYAEAEELLATAIELGDAPDLYDRNREIVEELENLAEATGEQGLADRAARLADERTRRSFDTTGARRSTTMLRRYEATYLRYHTGQLALDEEERTEVERIARLEVVPIPAIGRKERDSDGEVAEGGTAEGTAGITVTTFGRFLVEIDGRSLDGRSFGRKRARRLFKLLLVNHRKVVTIDRIEEALWGQPVTTIGSLVMNAASHVRAALGVGADEGQRTGPRLDREGEGYRLDLGLDAGIDFLQFKDRIVAARHGATAAERLDRYRAACRIADGPFLPDVDAPWVENERRMLEDAWLEGMEFVTRELVRTGRRNEAIEESRLLLARDSTNLGAWKVLLTSLVDLGRTTTATNELERCRTEFRALLDQDVPEDLVRVMEG